MSDREYRIYQALCKDLFLVKCDKRLKIVHKLKFCQDLAKVNM